MKNFDNNSYVLESDYRVLESVLRNIVMLDDDAHPGLSTWHDARVKAHKAAKAILTVGEKT